MEKLLWAMGLLPLVVAITQGMKQIIPENLYKFLRLLNCGLGIIAAYGYVAAIEMTDMNNAMIIMGGVVVGLAASGLYEVGKNTLSVFKK